MAADRQHLLDEVRRRAGMRRRNRHRVMAGAAVLTAVAVLAVAVQLNGTPGGAKKVQILSPPGGATTSTAESAPSTVVTPTTLGSRPALESTTLAVAICPTTFGITPPPAPASVPATMVVAVPPSLRTQLAIYTDDQGSMKLLAPRGWGCTASYGADGSGGVAAFPVGQSLPASWPAGWKLSPGSPDQAVVGLETSACQGCTNGQACPLFTAAASAFLSQIGHTCPDVRPPSETVHPISANIVGFLDPPGVVGDGVPSGGQDPANGVMTYYPGDTHGSWLETCTLPSPDKQVCTTVLNQFLTSYGHE